MSATTANRDAPGIYHKAGSLRAERRWALWTAYISLIVAAIIFLAVLVDSLRTRALSLRKRRTIRPLEG